jgi:hypothetical protein
MMIRRCAWHRLYNGYPMVYGVAAWRQSGLQYTDGMCRRCAATAMEQWTTGAAILPSPSMTRGLMRAPAGRAGIAIAAASILVALLLTVVARRDDGPAESVAALPRAVTGAGPETAYEVCADPAPDSALPAAGSGLR